MSAASSGDLGPSSTLFVLAGGQGRRLETLTRSTPKGLWGDAFEPPLTRLVRFAEESGLFDNIWVVAPAGHVGAFEVWASSFQLPIRVISKRKARPRGVDDVLWAIERIPPGAITVTHADTWFESNPFEQWGEPHWELELAGGVETIPGGAMSAVLSFTGSPPIVYEKNLASAPFLQKPDRWAGMWRIAAETRHSLPELPPDILVESLVDALSRHVPWRVVHVGGFINLNTPDHVKALREQIY